MQTIEQINVDEFIELSQNIFELNNIVGLASGLTVMFCLILPALWLGDLLGQNKLAAILSWACRRCMVRYHELGQILLEADGSAAPTAPRPRETRFHHVSYAVREAGGSAAFLEAIDASPHVRPALLNLGAGLQAIGAAGLDRGVLAGITDDWVHFAELGIVKMAEQCTTLLIVDTWATPAEGVLAVRRFELRISDMESFTDGIVNRRGFPAGFLREALLTAGERIDLSHLFVAGVGTDGLVIPDSDTRIAFLKMMDDLIFICCMVAGISMVADTLEDVQKANFRFVPGLAFGQCNSCGHIFFPPVAVCSFCTTFKRLFEAYSKFKFNKFHVWQHLGDMIRELGMVWNYWMQ